MAGKLAIVIEDDLELFLFAGVCFERACYCTVLAGLRLIFVHQAGLELLRNQDVSVCLLFQQTSG